MDFTRGIVDGLPYASVGTGRPVVVAAGLWPTTGVDSDIQLRCALAPLAAVRGRRLIVLNRRGGLQRGTTIGDLARGYADFIRADVGHPVDVVGTSTGGSIAQTLAAAHPDVVDRLVLVSTACRLGDDGRRLQADVATELRAGRTRTAVARLMDAIAPPGLRTAARTAGWAGASRIIPDFVDADDLAATLEAEDGFDLGLMPQPIKAKTLIVGGARDRFYSPCLFGETAQLIPESHIRIYPHRGHTSVTLDRRSRSAISTFLTTA